MKERNSLRDTIFQVIADNPGIHFREIQRKSGSAVGQLEYHIYQLEKQEKISIKQDGKLKRYFVVTGTGFSERKLIYYLRNGITREIVYDLLSGDSVLADRFVKGRRAKQAKIREAIAELIHEGIVESRVDHGNQILFLRDPAAIKAILNRFRESFLDSLTSNVLSLLD